MTLHSARNLDQWRERRGPEERALLIENRRGEFGREHRQMVNDANEPHPFKPDQPTLFAVSSDHDTGRFRLPPMLVEYLEPKAREHNP